MNRRFVHLYKAMVHRPTVLQLSSQVILAVISLLYVGYTLREIPVSASLHNQIFMKF